jgi:hypothetical protein
MACSGTTLTFILLIEWKLLLKSIQSTITQGTHGFFPVTSQYNRTLAILSSRPTRPILSSLITQQYIHFAKNHIAQSSVALYHGSGSHSPNSHRYELPVRWPRTITALQRHGQREMRRMKPMSGLWDQVLITSVQFCFLLRLRFQPYNI